jgi:BirA family transcriptional regulator, biotin operon repressor / biotin---[acetyl-CoA-carboxylase] ligase
MLDLDRLEASGVVRMIDYQPSLGSTSDRAIELAAQGDVNLPLLVVTDEQTAGRGRGTNRWLSSQGALTFSLALEAPPELLPQARWPEVALIAGLAVCRALKEAAPRADFRVKWPNDVYLNGQKVCGILSESVPGWRDRLVVGIGVNVNNRVASGRRRGSYCQEQEPPGNDALPKSAVSLIDHDGMPRDLTEVLISILDHFDQVWHRLIGEGPAELLAEYRSHCFLTGKTVTVAESSARQTIGLCLGIDDSGRLRLQTQTGPKTIASGTILTWDG